MDGHTNIQKVLFAKNYQFSHVLYFGLHLGKYLKKYVNVNKTISFPTEYKILDGMDLYKYFQKI